MPSMFEDTTMKLVKQIGDSELRPVKSLLDATKIRPFSLIRRNKPRSLFWKPSDVPLDISVMHILKPSSSVPDAAGKVPFQFRDRVAKQLQGSGSVTAGPQVSLLGSIAESQGASLECQIVTHRDTTWEDLQQRTLKDPEPCFLKQCREAGVKLYVVTETVELVKGCVLEDCSSVDLWGKFSVPWNTFVKTDGQGGARRVSQRELTVPAGSAMAYKRKQLVFLGNTCGILLFVDDDNQETFLEERVQKPLARYFKCLQEEVSEKVSAAQHSKNMKDVLFSGIRAMLGDREALQDLVNMLEWEPLGHMTGPGGTILNELREDTSSARVSSAQLILYLLDAILVLSDVQRDLLAQSMDRKILLQQQYLVRSILEPNFKCSQRIPFTLRLMLLAPLHGKNLAITYDLLNECGLKMELNRPWSTWDPEAKEPLCALYGTLSVLQQLAEP
uniref:Gasdermin C n=1 Tax=Molossus molossus TaxID=27622 RepID=A0A7J8DT63_MOLMO|nr:gasdermin C [Molossus molossus]